MGVQFANGGVIDLHEGEVSHNDIGANVQGAQFDSAKGEDSNAWRSARRAATAAQSRRPLLGCRH